jgi:hypothetical protein
MKAVLTPHGRLLNPKQELQGCSYSLSIGTVVGTFLPFLCVEILISCLLYSEHLMRRIACESDFQGDGDSLVRIYNDGLGKGLMSEKALDAVYEAGSAESLGYVK